MRKKPKDPAPEDQPTQQWSASAPGQDDDDLDLLAESGRKITKLTVFLMAAVLVGVAFIGGVMVQKQWGSSSSASPGGMSAMSGSSRSEGAGSGGGMPSGGEGASAMGGGSQDSQSQSGSTGTTGSSTPVVVGTLTKVSGRTLTVKNFAGESVTVKVPTGTTISDSSDTALSGLAKGASVSVVGSEADDGTVTATSITVS